MSGRPHWQRWWSIGGAITGLLALAWAFWRVEYDRMLDVLDQSNPNFVLMVAVAFIGAFALWRSGIALDQLRLAEGDSVGSS